MELVEVVGSAPVGFAPLAAALAWSVVSEEARGSRGRPFLVVPVVEVELFKVSRLLPWLCRFLAMGLPGSPRWPPQLLVPLPGLQAGWLPRPRRFPGVLPRELQARPTLAS